MRLVLPQKFWMYTNQCSCSCIVALRGALALSAFRVLYSTYCICCISMCAIHIEQLDHSARRTHMEITSPHIFPFSQMRQNEELVE